MKTRFASSIRLPLMAGALALFAAGCSSMHGSSDRSADRGSMDRTADRGSMNRADDRAGVRAGYVGQSDTPGIPPRIDPFSRSYVPFPVTANESAGITGHSPYCVQHYSQPGCQTPDSARNSRGGMSDSGRY